MLPAACLCCEHQHPLQDGSSSSSSGLALQADVAYPQPSSLQPPALLGPAISAVQYDTSWQGATASEAAVTFSAAAAGYVPASSQQAAAMSNQRITGEVPQTLLIRLLPAWHHPEPPLESFRI